MYQLYKNIAVANFDNDKYLMQTLELKLYLVKKYNDP